MSRDRCISCRACQVFALTERNVLALRVLVALGKAKVDDVDIILCALVAANQEIIGLDISVDDALFMDFLNAMNLQKSRK